MLLTPVQVFTYCVLLCYVSVDSFYMCIVLYFVCACIFHCMFALCDLTGCSDVCDFSGYTLYMQSKDIRCWDCRFWSYLLSCFPLEFYVKEYISESLDSQWWFKGSVSCTQWINFNGQLICKYKITENIKLSNYTAKLFNCILVFLDWIINCMVWIFLSEWL